MFRTRDFVLLFGMIVFLLVAIGTTLFRQSFSTDDQVSTAILTEVSEQERTAVVAETPKLDREANLASLRHKLAEDGEFVATEPVEVAVEVEDVVDSAISPEESESVAVLQTCPGYISYGGYWSPQNVQFELAEGTRVVYRAVETVVGTSTVNTKETLLQLPASPIYGGSYCLASDVIGVAQDGSLIRNSEVGLYGVFGEHTLIGYALDGFPIYGTSDLPTDACGGAVVADEYRYVLKEGREVMINCFSATPVSL
ncbi:MAG: hypothetical protein KBC35_02425 [Candidatus Pacebacteria bacterium]|nr:hypothetical protein [Candidatus Paceibacterota bacterium]